MKPQDATITINTCDALSAMTGGYFKSSVHRVSSATRRSGAHRPSSVSCTLQGKLTVIRAKQVEYLLKYAPKDQNNQVVLDPIENSPLMQRMGLVSNDFTNLGKHLTMAEWCKSSSKPASSVGPRFQRSKAISTNTRRRRWKIIPGLHAKVYN